MRAPARWWLSLALALLFFPASSGATVMQYLSGPDLARQAKAVLIGRVVGAAVAVVDQRYWTDTEIEVTRALRGGLRVGERVVVRQPGGVVGPTAMIVEGSATFAAKEQVVLFVHAVGGRLAPVGMAQGKFSLYRDAAGVERARRDPGRTMWIGSPQVQHDFSVAEVQRIVATTPEVPR